MSLPQPTAIDCIFENILGFMLPFFLASAGGDPALARAAIQELAEAYNAATVTELEVVGRLIGFSVVAMDNLRLSMNQDLSDTKVLHYRSNAVALSRAAEQCRTILVVLQDNRKPGQKPLTIPAPAIAAAPAEMVQTKPLAIKPGQHPRTSVTIRFPETTEAAKQDARMLLAMFARNGGASAQTTAIFPHIPDPAAAVDAAVRQAFSASRQNAAA